MDISATPSTRPARAPGLVARWQQRFSSSRRPRHDDPRMFAPLHEGDDYLTLLARLHRALEPRNYLEIGVRRGDSLALATCPVIGIDPAMAPKREVFREKPSVFLFPLTSDTFFERHDPTALFGRPVDMAFLDGLHEYETLLRDFVNTERLDLGTIGVAAHLASLPVQDTSQFSAHPRLFARRFLLHRKESRHTAHEDGEPSAEQCRARTSGASPTYACAAAGHRAPVVIART